MLWFDEDVTRRHTGAASPWQRKTREEKAAIIMAANDSTLRADMWELLTQECRDRYLTRARQFLLEGGTLRGEPPNPDTSGQDRGVGPARPAPL